MINEKEVTVLINNKTYTLYEACKEFEIDCEEVKRLAVCVWKVHCHTKDMMVIKL